MGGTFGKGTIFKLGTDGSVEIAYSFGGREGDPIAPQGSLIQGPDGALYGTSPSGGAGRGTVFRLDAAGGVTVVYAFGTAGPSSDGSGPSAFLTLGRDGNLYGTTRSGGANFGGTAFRLSLAGSLTTLFSFGPNQEQPYDPEMGLVEAGDGALYGFTFYNEGLGAVGDRPGSSTMYKLTIQ